MSQSSSQPGRIVGARLREIRMGLGLSLSDVETKSNGRWKAVVVGSYERADRALTVARLVELARFYGVSARRLLPEEESGPPSIVEVARYARIVANHVAAQAARELGEPDKDGAVAA